LRILGVIAASLLLFVFSGVESVYAQSGTVTATVRPNPLKVQISAPSTYPVNKWFPVSADITNQGADPITKIIVTLNADPGIRIKSSRKKIGTLGTHQTTNISWEAKATAVGNFIITAEATGNLLGETISSSDSAMIVATGSLGAFLLRLIFGA